jgi:hypothetical protein
MCRYISFRWQERWSDIEICVGCLYSHAITKRWLRQNYPDMWGAGYYQPSGKIEMFDTNGVQSPPAIRLLKKRFPTFAKFEEFALAKSAHHYDHRGRDHDGFDRDGLDRYGLDRNGFDREGFDINGLDHDGYDRRGFDINGLDYDGYDHQGYDINGFDDEGFNRRGFDCEGNSRNNTD